MTTRRQALSLLAAAQPAVRSLLARPETRETVATLRFSRTPVVRVGIIGVGHRGMSLLDQFLVLDSVRVHAICDLVPARAREAVSKVQCAGRGPARVYAAGETDFENLCRGDDLDLVIVATPWKWHAPMALCAMQAGRHVAVEVPLATTLEDCWKLVDASEQTRRHCILLENCCYGYNELLVLNLVRDGRLGELTHGAGGYLHYLGPQIAANPERFWMRAEYATRNGNLYPTHGVGPLARYMDIHRGDRFESLVSVSSKASERLLRCGDQSTTLIRTANGRLITLEHNVATPQPYDRVNLIAGTRGVFRDFPPRLYLAGETPGETWEALDRFKPKYEHRLWTLQGKSGGDSNGHDDMDFVMCYRLIECLREGLAPDIDVYDGAAWSAIGPLSEQSVAGQGTRVNFPDFTRGGWKQASEPKPATGCGAPRS